MNKIEENIDELISDNSRPESLVNALQTFIIGVASGLANREDEVMNKVEEGVINAFNYKASIAKLERLAK